MPLQGANLRFSRKFDRWADDAALGRDAFDVPGVCCLDPRLQGGFANVRSSALASSNTAAESGFLEIRHIAKKPRARPAGAVLGRDALELPGDCVQARRNGI
jgi:hypothetical protein